MSNENIQESVKGQRNSIIDEMMIKTENELFKIIKEENLIENAVLIMNPKNKKLIVESNLNAYILWTDSCPENKAYQVVDEFLKNYIKSSMKI